MVISFHARRLVHWVPWLMGSWLIVYTSPRIGLCITTSYGTHEDERTVLYKTKSLDGTKPNTNPKTKTKINRNPNENAILCTSLRVTLHVNRKRVKLRVVSLP